MPKKKRNKEDREERLLRMKTMLTELLAKEKELRLMGANISADSFRKQHIVPLWKRLEQENRPKPQPLLELAQEAGYDPKELIHLIIKVHMTADYLTDLVARMKDELKKLGADKCNFFTVTDEAFKQLQFLASMMAGKNYGPLADVIVDDDDYLEAMDELNDDYLRSRGACPDQWRKAQEQAVDEREGKPIERDY